MWYYSAVGTEGKGGEGNFGRPVKPISIWWEVSYNETFHCAHPKDLFVKLCTRTVVKLVLVLNEFL